MTNKLYVFYIFYFVYHGFFFKKMNFRLSLKFLEKRFKNIAKNF